jgi:hypothetical protein
MKDLCCKCNGSGVIKIIYNVFLCQNCSDTCCFLCENNKDVYENCKVCDGTGYKNKNENLKK